MLTFAIFMGFWLNAVSGDEALKQPAFVAASGSPFFVGPMAGRPVVADLDEDGSSDVVLACGTCCGSKPDVKSGHVIVLLGDGEGGLNVAPGSPVKVGSSVRKVAVGDVNEDQHLDVVAAEHDSYQVTILLGDGSGKLTRAASSSLTASQGGRPHTHEIVLADVNGDRHLDLLTTNANDHNVSVLLGDGTGGFKPAAGSPFAAGRHPYDAIVVADVNGDARADIVTPDLQGGAINVLLGTSAGGFAVAPGAPLKAGPRPGYVAVLDVDGDRKLDVVATHDDEPLLAVFLGDGSGKFTPAAAEPMRLPCALWGIATGDFNGDGRPDLALGNGNGDGPEILLGKGDGSFAHATDVKLRGGAGAGYTAVADLNDDKRLDVITANYRSGDVSVYLGK